MAEQDSHAAWLQAEGIPAPSDEFVQKYFQGRDALIVEEKKQRSDHYFRQNLSPVVQEACAIVDQIRFEEQQTLWTREFEDSLSELDGDIYPGMMFSLAKDRMERSKLWQIVHRMPKGTLLHCHLEATVDFEWALEEAFAMDGWHIQASQPLCDERSLAKGDFRFRWSKAAPATVNPASLWSKDYAPQTPVPLQQAADAFPNGGKSAFLEWVHSRWTITPVESLKHHHGTNEIWRKFMSCFPIIGSIIYYEPIFRKLVRRLCKHLMEDGVQYVEARSAFYPFTSEGRNEPDEDFTNLCRAFQEEVANFKATEEGKDFWGVRVIFTSIRAFDTRVITSTMKHCISLKQQFPDLICGYDLVGQEDLGRPLADLIPELFWFKKKCVEAGVDIPFFFHAGETLGDGDSVDENLFDAILLGTRRIGHGFSLFKHPLLIDMIKEKRILIESCPVSNEVLRFTSSIMAHPLPALLARGVPCSLCNDDPTILGQGRSGMTHDFWQALQGWENLGLAGLGSLAENSVRWAAFEDCSAKEWSQSIKSGVLGDSIRAERLKEWMVRWERYCQWIVDEYGVDENLNPAE